MNLYVAGATLGATTTVAVAAVWILGSGGSLDGIGAGEARKAQYMDMQVAPYMARIVYEGGSSALVPISIAFRVEGKDAGKAFCKDMRKIQRAVTAFMRKNVGNRFHWKEVASSGLGEQLAERVNDITGKRLVDRVYMAAGDQGVGDKPMSCSRLARQ